MTQEIELNAKNRIKEIALAAGTKKINIEVSRDNCNDILLETVSQNGQSKGKPLNKYLPGFKADADLAKLRFIMNDFSTRPITISLNM